ncbi:MAG TPA: TonB-dependent receptor [Puia sp.]
MRLTAILLLAATLHVSAKTFSQKINISEKNISLKNVFYLIRQQTGYSFLWDQQSLEAVKPLNIDCRNATLSQTLDQCLAGLPITYSIREKDKIVFLMEKPRAALLPADSTSAPEVFIPPPVKIQGKLTNEQGEPLQGVSVIVQGASRGVSSNENGLFTIQAEPGDVLQFSMVGYTTYTVKLKTGSNLKIVLQNVAVNLSDMVVVGYGTQKKVNVTGAVATVKGTEIQQSPASNIANSLEGRMAGVIVNNRSGAPGDDAAEIFIRGKGSWNGGGPLIIIDGIANRSGFERLNPADIESISVLKDASASIYGSRAANGVILVTTKRGKEGKANFSYAGNYGLTQPTRLTKFANSWEAATYQNEDNVYLYGTPKYSPAEIQKFKDGTAPNLYPNYNIYDLMLKSSAPQTSHSLAVRGGTQAVKYYFSGGYLYQDSYFKDGIDHYKSYNLRSNIDATINKNLTLSIDLAGRLNRRQNATTPLSIFELMLVNTPTLPLFYSNGLPAEVYGANLVRLAQGKGGTTNYGENILNSQLSFKWQLPFVVQGLYVSGVGAFDYTNTVNKAFTDTYDYYKYDGSTDTYGNANVNPSLGRSLNQKFYNSYSNTLNLRVGFNRAYGGHAVDAFVAYEQYTNNNEWISATRSVFLSNQIPYLFFGSTSNQQNDGRAAQTAYRNLFGRVAYNFDERYLVDFTLRRDESVKFANGRRTGVFPGISAGWRLSKESFIKDHFPSIDQLKLRASWGQAGSDAVADFQYLQTYVLGTGYGFGTQPQTYPTINSSGVANPFITWEVSNNTNIGLEGSFKNGLFGFEADYFISKRNNILAKKNASVPTYTGLVLPDQNIGRTQNQGIELLLKYNNRITKDLTYSLNFNFTYVKNKVLFRDESPLIPAYQKAAGHSIDAYSLYQTDGIFHTQKDIDDAAAKYPGTRVGDIRYVDFNGDGVINSKDMVKMDESPIPQLIYGLTLGVKYKGVSVNALLQGQAKARVWLNPTTRNGNINVPKWMYQDRWTTDNPGGTMPRAFNNRSETVNELASDFWLRNAAFIRLKTVEISYTIPERMVRNLGIQNLRLYVNGFNLLTFSKMKGDYDPEMNNALGVYYPQTRIFNAGVNLTF